MKKKVLSLMLAGAMVLSMAACGSQNTDQGAANDTSAKAEQSDSSEAAKENSDSEELESTQITVFAAASLENALNEVIKKYNETQPNVTIIPSYDSSGTLLAQIEEGAACDVFFSAATKQMNALVEGGYVQEADVTDLLENKVQLIKPAGTETKVTGFENITDAANLALAADTVPVGQYAREIFDNLGITDQVMAMEINECEDVSAVLAAVSEGSNEVGIVYATDAASVADKVEVIATANDTELKSKVTYPVGLVKNTEADDAEVAAAKAFVDYLKTPEAAAVFEKYGFSCIN